MENRFIGETPAEIGPFEDGKRVRIRLERDGFETVSLRHRVGRSDESLSRIALNRSRRQTGQPERPERVRVPMGFELKNTIIELPPNEEHLLCVFYTYLFLFLNL